jgi:primosomal replication protein N
MSSLTSTQNQLRDFLRNKNGINGVLLGRLIECLCQEMAGTDIIEVLLRESRQRKLTPFGVEVILLLLEKAETKIEGTSTALAKLLGSHALLSDPSRQVRLKILGILERHGTREALPGLHLFMKRHVWAIPYPHGDKPFYVELDISAADHTIGTILARHPIENSR